MPASALLRAAAAVFLLLKIAARPGLAAQTGEEGALLAEAGRGEIERLMRAFDWTGAEARDEAEVSA